MRNGVRKRKVVIMGAAGRDFHNFNIFFRNKKYYEVIAFTAAQIPNIEMRIYPPELSGGLYPKGIPIYPESRIKEILEKNKVDEAVLAYSDLSNEEVMEKASIVLSYGADFRLMGPYSTMLKSKKPVISVCAVRTGAGKGVTTRKIIRILREKGYKAVVVRHPMPYGDLKKQICQRFSKYEDLGKNDCTLEEIEEYEPHIREGVVVYAGVDYSEILKDVTLIKENVKRLNPKAKIIMADMPKYIDKPQLVMKKRVLVVEDGPTLTHGGLSYGAGALEAKRLKAKIIDPRPYATSSIKEVYKKYPHIWKVLPAIGYGKAQMEDLEKTINRVPCDTVLIGTPIDLGRYIKINKLYARVTYDIKEIGKPSLEGIISGFISHLSNP